MKVNFSIDFILGRCGKKNETSSKMKQTTMENHTVQWMTNNNELGQYPEKNYNNFLPLFDDSSKIFNIGQPPTSSELSGCFCNLYNEALQPLTPCHLNEIYSNCTSMKQLCRFVAETPAKFDQMNKQRQASKKKYSFAKKKQNIKDSKINYKQYVKYTKAINIKEREKAKERTKSRVGRRLFKGNQILALEKAFALNSYLTRTERAALAEKINLTECQIKTWFQNRRTKQKRRGTDCDDINDVSELDEVSSEESYQPRSIHVPGHGVQARPTYGPPDKYLKAAIVDYLKRHSIKNKKE